MQEEPSTKGENENSVTERIASVETDLKNLKNNFAQRISLWLGIGAIIISITSGGYSLYSNIFLVPQQEKQDELNELGQMLSKINDLTPKRSHTASNTAIRQGVLYCRPSI